MTEGVDKPILSLYHGILHGIYSKVCCIRLWEWAGRLPLGLPAVPGDLVATHVLFPGCVAMVPDGGDAAGALLRLDLQQDACWASLRCPEMLETRLQTLKLLGMGLLPASCLTKHHLTALSARSWGKHSPQ